MAESNPDFDPAGFRDAVRFAMNMGLPNTVSERATFRRSSRKDYAIEDPAGRPYDFTDSPTRTVTQRDVQVPVAVEFAARPSGSFRTTLGEFDSSRAIVTVLDEDYALIEGSDQVLLGGNVYEVQFIAPPIGLFDVTVYQLHCQAVDEA